MSFVTKPWSGVSAGGQICDNRFGLGLGFYSGQLWACGGRRCVSARQSLWLGPPPPTQARAETGELAAWGAARTPGRKAVKLPLGPAGWRPGRRMRRGGRHRGGTYRGGRHRGGGHFGQAMARQRLALVSVSFLFVALGVGLAVFAFRDALTFFLTPSELTASHVGGVRPFRLGGLVQSVETPRDAAVTFLVADELATVQVVYEGLLPDLFREGQGVVALGTLDEDGIFYAQEVLAKHDETYMAPELKKALDEQKAMGAPGAPGGPRESAAYPALNSNLESSLDQGFGN